MPSAPGRPGRRVPNRSAGCHADVGLLLVTTAAPVPCPATCSRGVRRVYDLVVSTPGAEYNLTVWNAAAADGTLVNLPVAAGIGTPFVPGYAAVMYRLFRTPGHPQPALKEAPHAPG